MKAPFVKAPHVPRVGGILSADIAVPEHDKEVSFYSRVLTTGENPLWNEDLANNLGSPIIGLGQQSPAYANLPLQWMPHIQVADVAASAARGVELGGTELLHGKDDDGNSLWAGLLDPNGVGFGIIPVVTEEQLPKTDGGDGVGPAGCIAWVDLTVPNAQETSDFYLEVAGWTVQEVPTHDDGGSYVDSLLLGGDQQPAAAIRHARGENTGLPAVWLLYLPVGDLAESLKRVAAEGGKVIKEMPAADGRPASAVIQDPVGVHIALMAV